jgi:ABC-2 type transport system permease protein
MQINTPSVGQALTSLLKADFLVQWRQKKSPLMATMLAIVILVTWKNLAHNSNGPLVLVASCITIVLLGIGIMSYPGLISRDRERGVFQRLRVTPAPVWTIMLSRLIVQAAIIALSTCVVLLSAAIINNFQLTMTGYVLTIAASVVCGSLFLGIGQMLAGFIKSTDTLNSAGRFIYFPLAFGGALAELNYLGKTTKAIIDWSPYGTAHTVLQAAMNAGVWNFHIFTALVLTILYAFIFAIIGIKWFKWNN